MRVPCVRVDPQQGEPTRQALAESELLDQDLEIDHDNGWLFIPITDPTAVPDQLDVVEHEVDSRDQRVGPTDLLEFNPGYERLGELVLLDESDPDRAKTIAEAVMGSDMTVKTVLNKASKIKGQQRVREWEVIAGDGTETVHREFGSEFALDLEKVYFSPRLATERHRVVSQVQPGEQVMDMFAGVGPYAIQIAKQGATVAAVDINPDAVEYCRANARRNDVQEAVTVLEGDVRSFATEYAGWADRLVMNLPHSATEYLDVALEMAADEAIIHVYDIQSEPDPFEAGETALTEAASPEYDISIDCRHEVRSYAPHEFNICLDARISRR